MPVLTEKMGLIMSEENFEEVSKMGQLKAFISNATGKIAEVSKKVATYLPTKLLFYACKKQNPKMADVALNLGADANGKSFFFGKIDPRSAGYVDKNEVYISPFILAAVVACEQGKQNDSETRQFLNKLHEKTDEAKVAEMRKTVKVSGAIWYLPWTVDTYSLTDAIEDRDISLPVAVCQFLKDQYTR